ncbi:MAG: SDR family NAD(P)-dependent oxidoreductase [Dehalococcoidia bacterium]|nr:SDR family NAD(P)-dependent oxidoreductase [Dehalococcoidia bacterium]
MHRFQGKVAIVTGAGQDAGRAASMLFAREGASVVVNDRDSGTAQRLVEEIVRSGGQAVPDSGDVSTADGAEGVVARAVETFGGLDILVNVCQPDCDRPLVETTAEDFERTVRLTLKGAFMPTRSASVQFRQQRSGRVVSITSNAGLGDSGGASSAAASEGIVGMTRTAARDLGRYGVTCNAIAMSEASDDGSQSVASLAATLCLDDSSHVNGIVFGVDGGDILTYSNPAVVRSFHKWGPSTLDEMDLLFPSLFE